MKKLLLSVAALMVATLLFSQVDTNDVDDGVTQDNKQEQILDAENAS